MMGIVRRNKLGYRTGFTIVELLIVIVVIAILASISIVAYNGIQQRARSVAVKSALSQASKKVLFFYYADNNSTYPSTLAVAGVNNDGAISYSYSTDTNGYCITALYNGKTPTNIKSDGTTSDGPCDGQSGGSEYCPSNSFVPTNGYYCDGTEGAVATLNTGVIKLAGSAAGVPVGAPGGFVGRQSSRDNYASNSFSVTAGDVYCVEGWVATTDSTVGHGIGLQMTNTSGANSWQSGSASSGWATTAPTSTWKKLNGCITVPAGFVTARFWTQNDGASGTTANAYWYQTALRLWKQ